MRLRERKNFVDFIDPPQITNIWLFNVNFIILIIKYFQRLNIIYLILFETIII